MAEKITDAALSYLGGKTQATVSSWRVRLFKNNFTPDESTVVGDFTEANFSGYAEGTPSFGSWSVTSHIAQSAAAEVTFTHNGGGTSNSVYGWYLVDTSTSPAKVLVATQFTGAPLSMASSGDQIGVSVTEFLKQY